MPFRITHDTQLMHTHSASHSTFHPISRRIKKPLHTHAGV